MRAGLSASLIRADRYRPRLAEGERGRVPRKEREGEENTHCYTGRHAPSRTHQIVANFRTCTRLTEISASLSGLVTVTEITSRSRSQVCRALFWRVERWHTFDGMSVQNRLAHFEQLASTPSKAGKPVKADKTAPRTAPTRLAPGLSERWARHSVARSEAEQAPARKAAPEPPPSPKAEKKEPTPQASPKAAEEAAAPRAAAELAERIAQHESRAEPQEAPQGNGAEAVATGATGSAEPEFLRSSSPQAEPEEEEEEEEAAPRASSGTAERMCDELRRSLSAARAEAAEAQRAVETLSTKVAEQTAVAEAAAAERDACMERSALLLERALQAEGAEREQAEAARQGAVAAVVAAAAAAAAAAQSC